MIIIYIFFNLLKDNIMKKLLALTAVGLVLGLSAVSFVAPHSASAIGEGSSSDGTAAGNGTGTGGGN